MCTVFFFKQKTAYEMRISDWSSDVCSSDLSWRQFVGYRRWRRCGAAGFAGICESQRFEAACAHPVGRDGGRLPRTNAQRAGARSPQGAEVGGYDGRRSEEHTSELQSLMRISYAVFCLKKTNETELKDERLIEQQR